MDLVSVDPEEALPRLRERMRRVFDAYDAHRADPARLPVLDVFNWEDVMVNTIYADGLGLLADLCRAAGHPPAEATEFERRSRRVRNALEENCWDDRVGVFWDLYGTDEQPARVLTFACLF